jgi:hypothetical protein
MTDPARPAFRQEMLSKQFAGRMPPWRRHVQEQAGVGVAETLERVLRQPVELVLAVRFSHREQHRDRLGAQAAGNEGQDRDRLPIEPVRIVDQAQKWPLFRHLREQAEGCQADQEVSGGGPSIRPKARPKRVPLWRRQPRGLFQDRGTQ